MKKLLVLAAAAVVSFGAAAQTPVGYQGEVDLGYSVGVGTFATGRINLHTVHGVKVGKYFSAGVGLGLDMYHEGGFEMMMPVYLNLKGYLPTGTKATPYLSMDIGAGVGVTEGVSGASGFYFTPAVGVKVGAFKAQVGYNVQRLSEAGFGVSMNAFQIKVGVVF